MFFKSSISAYRLHCKTKSRSVKSANRQNAPTIDVWDGISISELSKITKRPLSSIIRSVNSGLLGSLRVNASTAIENRDLLTGLVSLLGYRPNFISRKTPLDLNKSSTSDEFDVHPRPPADPRVCVPRPPVVAIMGHVDHGKTTLLDALRSSRIVDEEFGGITQHLSAFSLSIAEAAASAASNSSEVTKIVAGQTGDGVITFLDTPGHAAFSAMRARGAKATDIVLLVVAADDGVMPQTVESIKFAKEYGAHLIVAINKIDKYGVDVNRAIQGLAAHGVLVELLGGEVQAVEVSALKRINLVALLEAIVAQAEMMQISADPSGPAEAIVLECRTEHGLGKVVNCLVTRGELKQGSASGPLIAGESLGCTRVLRNDRGVRVSSVTPGYTASIAGWKSFPSVGSIILEVSSDSEADAAIRTRRQRRLEQKCVADKIASDKRTSEYRAIYETYLKKREKMNYDSARRFAIEFRKSQAAQLLDSGKAGEVVSLPLVIKADVEGSLEAISDMLATCPSDRCRIQIAFSGVGPVTPAEVELASAIGAEIFAFNTNALPDAELVLNAHNMFLHSHNIIYRLAEDVRSLVADKLPPVYAEEVIGEGVVLRTFEVTVVRGKRQKVMVGGCRCIHGNILSGKSTKHGTEPILFRVLRASSDSGSKKKDQKATKKVESNPSDSEGGLTSEDLVLIDRAPCFSLRHERNTVDSVRKDVEFGIILLKTSSSTVDEPQSLAELYHRPPSGSLESASVFDAWAPGDTIQCFRIVQRPQTLQWPIDYVDSNKMG
nr:translation initiation factor IF 2 [Hymenolepis microstoma]